MLARLRSAGMRLWAVAILCQLLASNAWPAERQMLHGNLPAAASRLAAIGPLDPTERLNLAIGLPLRNQEALAKFLQELSDPSSANYRKYITPAQFTEQFGPTEQDYQTLLQFANTHGLTVTGTYPNRVILDVEASVSDIEQVFHVKMRTYAHPNEAREFYAPDTEPSVDLVVPVSNVSGLDNYSLPHPNVKMKPAALAANVTANAGSGPGGTFAAGDFRAAYAPGTSLTGSGQSVGLLEFDGYYASDIAAYSTQFGLPKTPLVNVSLDGGVSTPGYDNIEVCLDIEMVMSMAPGVSAIYVYEAPNPSPWVDLLNKMANDNLAKQLSCSWSGGGPNAAAEAIFQQMAAQGQSFFNATGDSDAFTGEVVFPSDSPHITEVGATTLTMSGSDGSYVGETVWNQGGGIGSSGGISTSYAIPSWQKSVSMATNRGSITMRNFPDVALTGENVYVCCNNGSSFPCGGTSCAAPLWAAFIALVNQQSADHGRAPVGFINPAIYKLGLSKMYSSVFHDTTTGNNFSSGSPTKFAAVAGYDLCTGWGTPQGSELINALTGLQAPTVTTSTATGIASSVAILNGTVNPNGLTTTVYFQYGSTSACALSSATESVGSGTASIPFSLSVDGLKGDTVYYYRSVAVNGLGTTYGEKKTCFDRLPVAITGGAMEMTGNRFIVKGTVNPSGLATTAWFEYGTDTAYSDGTAAAPALPAHIGALNVTGTLASLLPGTAYHYRLVAANVSGTVYGEDQTLDSVGAPAASTGTADKVMASDAILSGLVNPSGIAASWYFEYWLEGDSPDSASQTKAVSAGKGVSPVAVSATVAHLAPLAVYSYRLVAVNASGTACGETATFTTAGAPEADTGPAVPSTARTVVTGSANSMGLATTVYFQYGPSAPGYSLKTPAQAAGAGKTWGEFTATLTGLKQGSAYHYRLVASNSSGTVAGPDEEFTTPSTAPDVAPATSTPGTAVTVTVTGTGESVAAISALVGPQSGAASIYFQYGLTDAYGKSTGAVPLIDGSASAVSTTLSGLAPHTAYHVRGIIQTARGTSATLDTAFQTLPRFDITGGGLSEIFWWNPATGETTLAAVATTGALAVNGTEAGPVLPANFAFRGEAEFNPDGDAYTLGWVLTGAAPAQTEFLTLESGSLSVTGTFPLVTGTFAAPAGSSVAAVADIDGDGNPDLILIDPTGAVTFWLLNGFTVVAQERGPKLPKGFQLAGVDSLSSNGKIDLLTWNPTTGQTKILALNGTALASSLAGPSISPILFSAGWQLAGVDVYTKALASNGAILPNWLLCNPDTGETQIWNVQGSTYSTLTGPQVPEGLTLISTK